CKAEQRLATFILEIALRFGTMTPAGCSLELPLSRTDMAHYLALNPDTMSRLMSRLKERGILATPSRGWVIVKQITALADLTPLTGALLRLWPDSPVAARLGGSAGQAD
ncbi:MAG: Crp/Fnr family transcriptional regulator, partial [Proteobacteria bacterium]|nr:Crp/Fnr family transcriptional regulator [Pseudomonadota bacterium]